MAPSPYPSNGTDWSAWTLGDLEVRAVEYADCLSGEFRRALAAARRKYETPAARVRREPLAFGITLWGPIPGANPASRIMWDGPGSGLYWQVPTGQRLPIRHRAIAGECQTLRDAERMARRFIAIGLDAEARDTRSDAEKAGDNEDIMPPVLDFLDRLGGALEHRGELGRQETIAAGWHRRQAEGRSDLEAELCLTCPASTTTLRTTR
jgi:hypothetical protein